MIISSFNGVKKLVTNLLDNYYCNKNNSIHKHKLYLSENQHNHIFYKKEYYNIPFYVFGNDKIEKNYQVECIYTKKIGQNPVLKSEKWVGETITIPCSVGVVDYIKEKILN